MAERSKALRSGRSPLLWAWVRIRTRFGDTYTKIGTMQRILAWPLRKDDTQNREAFHNFRRSCTPDYGSYVRRTVLLQQHG